MLRCACLFLAFALALPAWQEESKGEALLTAARRGDAVAVRQLVEGGVPVDTKNRYGITPLFYSVWSGHEEVARYLISKGADVNVRDTFYKMSTLATAISKKHEGIALALVEAGSSDSATALGMSVANNLPKVAAAILQKTKPSEAQLKYAVQTAADKGDEALVQMLLKAGAPQPRKLGAVVPAEVLAKYAGVYQGPQVGEMQIEHVAGKLMLKAMNTSAELLAYDQVTFAATAENFRGLTFEFVVEGEKAKSLKITQGSMTFTANRVEGK